MCIVCNVQLHLSLHENCNFAGGIFHGTFAEQQFIALTMSLCHFLPHPASGIHKLPVYRPQSSHCKYVSHPCRIQVITWISHAPALLSLFCAMLCAVSLHALHVEPGQLSSHQVVEVSL